MQLMRFAFLCATALGLSAQARAAGELHIYNWGDYTSPDLIKKFEKTYDVKVTLDSYDSNETMLSKVRSGGTGYDIVVPSDYTVKVMIADGLLEKTDPSSMPNFKNMDPRFVHVYWDDGRYYTVPWQFGITSLSVNTDKYKGDINTLALLYNPPEELRGQINMLDDMGSVISGAERYLGIARCTGDRASLKKVVDLLNAAKPFWKTFSYDTLSKLAEGDVIVSQNWNGYAWRARQQNPAIHFGIAREGLEGFMDNVAVLKGAANLENAKLFQNFIMDPENAAMISAYARYDNGIAGSHKYLEPAFANAPEISPPPGSPVPELVPPCPPDVVAIYNQIWTNLRK